MDLIDLDSPAWSQLRHCYGPATDTPQLLRQLQDFPPSGSNSEPWFTLWSSLCHQDDVYPASFAAVPHIVRVLASNPSRASYNFFLLPASIEIARERKGVNVPAPLQSAYFAALRNLPQLVGAASTSEWSESHLLCALAALAVGKGYHRVGEAALELEGDVAQEFIDWFRSR